jgi:cyclase
MQTLFCGSAAVLCLIGSASSWAQNPDGSKQAMSFNRVAGNVYMLDNGTTDFGGGGNIAVLVGNDALVLVDAQSRANVDATVAALRRLSNRLIRYVIDTHCHGDHTGGNETFQREGAVVVAHINVLRRLERKKCDETSGFPTITFDTELTLYVDGEEVRVFALPTGHTDGDAIVYFKKANVVHTGDAFVSINVPFHSSYAGGSILGLTDSLRKIVTLVPDDAKVIPGHGPQASISDIRHTIRVLDEVEDAVSQQVGAGKTLDELRAANLLDPWKDSLGAELDFCLTEFYRALVSQLPAR